MEEKEQSVELVKKDFVTQVSMRQISVEIHKSQRYVQQNSVLSKILPYITNRINVLIAVLAISMLVNAGLILGFVFMLVDHKGSLCRDPSALSHQKESVCLPCRFFFENHNTVSAYKANSHITDRERNPEKINFDRFNTRSSGEKEKMCCVDMKIGLEYLLGKMPGEQQRVVALQTTDPNCIHGLNGNETQNPRVPDPSGPTVAHLYLNTSSLEDELLEWKTVNSIGMVKSNDLIYQNGMMTIPKDGQYFVYCQITFHYSLPIDRIIKPIPVVHNIGIKQGHTTKILLQNKLSIPSDTFMESYLGAVLDLTKGNKLFVSVSNSSFVFPYYLTSMFGLYRVGL